MPVPSRHRTTVAAGLLVLLLVTVGCDVSTTPPSASGASPSASTVACGRDEIAASGIDGSIADSDGNPLDDIFVLLETRDGFRGTTRTAEDGVFSAPGVSGEFVITTVDIDYDPVTQRVTVPCGETVEVELVLTAVGE